MSDEALFSPRRWIIWLVVGVIVIGIAVTAFLLKHRKQSPNLQANHPSAPFQQETASTATLRSTQSQNVTTPAEPHPEPRRTSEQTETEVLVKYLPNSNATGVELTKLFANADFNHGLSNIMLSVAYLCPGHKTSCPGNTNAGFALNAESLGSDWIFQSQQPLKLSFVIDGKRLDLPYPVQWRANEGNPNVRAEYMFTRLPNSVFVRVCQGQTFSGQVGDVTYKLSANQLQQLCTFIKRFE
jgi:hypothetical protein